MWKLFSVLYFLTGCSAVEPAKIKVSMYYESLCPDSIAFIHQQFWPTYRDVGKEFFDMEFIPYGRASENNNSGIWIFSCQHGEKECSGNRFHGCALASSEDKEKTTAFILCAMGAKDSSDLETLALCTSQTGLSWDDIFVKCYETHLGTEIVLRNGNKTRELGDISFIPAIAINDEYNDTIETNAIDNFLELVCKTLNNEPTVCKR